MEDGPTDDAQSESSYQLGLAYQEARKMPEAREVFQRVVTDYPESIWREQSEARLRQLD